MQREEVAPERTDSYSIFRVATRARSIVEAINKPSKAGNAATVQTANRQCHYLHAHTRDRARIHTSPQDASAVPSRSIMKRVSFSVLRVAVPIYLAAIFNSSVSREAIEAAA